MLRIELQSYENKRLTIVSRWFSGWHFFLSRHTICDRLTDLQVTITILTSITLPIIILSILQHY